MNFIQQPVQSSENLKSTECVKNIRTHSKHKYIMSKFKLSLLGLAILFFSSTVFIACTNNDEHEEKTVLNTNLETENELTARWKNFEESVMITPSSRVTSKTNKSEISARSIIFKNFNPNFKLESTYVIDGYDYTDDGKINDLIAGDGIYTSVILLPNLKNDKSQSNKSQIHNGIVSSKFKYNDILLASKVGVSCKIRITHSGSSWFGNSCAGGCIELYDCEVSLEF
jgi:hypothetical protein